MVRSPLLSIQEIRNKFPYPASIAYTLVLDNININSENIINDGINNYIIYGDFFFLN